ncbi:type IV pilus assembly protein PilW [Povalibacter uvarum]|uniref:Type IV pilus assembly protein PilW n=1 Tax=Povalibacter uvarum TaxID=732238 RepID=A0A841HHP7_9GAMM|nr:PilW family protein [Povalibacter uvarum]MBB6091840.1 type IV pilus assembly protein PilW [Povalibacter uvarum]
MRPVPPDLAGTAAGFSLIEVIVALALTGMLLVGVGAIFVSSRSTSNATENLASVQENGRRALDEVVRAIRSAGSGGCAKEPSHIGSTLEAASDPRWDFLDGAVRGYQASASTAWTPSIEPALIPEALAGSDVLLLRGARTGAQPLRLQSAMTATTDSLDLTGKDTLRPGDTALVYDCDAEVYFAVSSHEESRIAHSASTSDGTPVNLSDSLGYAFRAGAEAVAVDTAIYYVARSGEVTSLWKRVGARKPQEIAQDIEQMQILFGVDTTSDSVVDDYVAADAVRDWREVLSIKVGLLIRSAEPGTTLIEREHPLLDVSVSTSDHYAREVLTATASIRAREPVY